MKPVLKCALETIVASIVFFAIGLATRMPALAFDQFYGLHAVLATPLFAFAIGLALRKGVHAGAVAAGSCLYGVLLGSMSPVMGAGAIAPAIVLLIVWGLMARSTQRTRMFASALAYGLAVYPITVIAGCLFGSASFGIEGFALQVAIMATLSIALAFLGALLSAESKEER